MKKLVSSLLIACCLGSVAAAQQVLGAKDVIQSLKAKTTPTEEVSAAQILENLRARIAVIPRAAENEVVALQTPEMDQLAALDIQIFFEYNSDVVKQASLPSLVQLGTALQSPELSASNFLVVGHTDATGARAYNLTLSERRAASVRNFLLASYPGVAGRLSFIGFGEEKLSNAANPEGEENRRVQIVNLGATK